MTDYNYKRILMINVGTTGNSRWVPDTMWVEETPEGTLPLGVYNDDTMRHWLLRPAITVGLTCTTDEEERAVTENDWIRRVLGLHAGRPARFVNVDLVNDLVLEEDMHTLDGLQTIDIFGLIRRASARLADKNPVIAALKEK